MRTLPCGPNSGGPAAWSRTASNGAPYPVAPEALWGSPRRRDHDASTERVNINRRWASTAPGALITKVRTARRLGIWLDGTADRGTIVDEKGRARPRANH